MPNKPISPSSFQVRFLESSFLTGVYSYPSAADVESPALREGETTLDARRRVLGDFVGTAAETDRRAGATLTASGFALTINGVLLTSGPVSAGVLAVLVIPALAAFVAGLLSFFYWVHPAPGGEEIEGILKDARGACIIKQFWTVVASMMALIALMGYGAAVFAIAFS